MANFSDQWRMVSNWDTVTFHFLQWFCATWWATEKKSKHFERGRKVGSRWRCETFSDCSNWGWVGFLWTRVKDFSTGLRFCFSLKINILCLNSIWRFSNTPEILRLIWSFQQPISRWNWNYSFPFINTEEDREALSFRHLASGHRAVRWQRRQHRSLNSTSTRSHQPDFSV